MKTKEQIAAEIAPLQRQLHRLRDAEAKVAAEKLVGRCFKYKNCYSCPSKPSDYWWLYIKVTGANYWPKTFEFQTDKDGHINIKTNDCAAGLDKDGNGYVEISAKEFARAWKTVQKCIAEMKP